MKHRWISEKIFMVLLLFLVTTGCCFLFTSFSKSALSNQGYEKSSNPRIIRIFKDYNSVEEKYEEYAPRLYHTLLSPTATRVITTTALIVSFVLLIRTRNPRIFLPFYFLAFLFAYLVPILQRLLTTK